MREFLLAGLLIALGLSLSACDAADDGGASDTARLTVRLTDAPFPFDLAEAADVTITRIELLAAEPDGDPANDTTDAEGVLDRIVLYDGDPFRLNLLDLRDGVDTLLVEAVEIPADGSYDRLVFFVGEDAEVRFTDGSAYPLKLPGARQSGVKVPLPAYAVDGDGEVDVLIDFDVEKSFVTRGNPAAPGFQGFLFKPVLEVESFDVTDRPDDEPDDDDSNEGSDEGESDDDSGDDDESEGADG